MRYLLAEVPDDVVDTFVEITEHMFPESKIKQVVLDGIDFDEAERVCH